MFNTDKLNFNILFKDTPFTPTTQTTWATQHANDFHSYFLDGLAPPTTIGDYLYTHLSLSGTNIQLITDFISTFSNGDLPVTDWINQYIFNITSYINQIIFTGTKTLTVYPFTVTSWTGTVNSSLALTSFNSLLFPLFDPSQNPPEDFDIWITAAISAFSISTKLCYLEFPTILLQ